MQFAWNRLLLLLHLVAHGDRFFDPLARHSFDLLLLTFGQFVDGSLAAFEPATTGLRNSVLRSTISCLSSWRRSM